MIGMFRFWWSSVKTVFLRCIVRIQRTTFKFYTINCFVIQVYLLHVYFSCSRDSQNIKDQAANIIVDR